MKFLKSKQNFIERWVEQGFDRNENCIARKAMHSNEEWKVIIEVCEKYCTYGNPLAKRLLFRGTIYRELDDVGPVIFDNNYVSWSKRKEGRTSGSALGKLKRLAGLTLISYTLNNDEYGFSVADYFEWLFKEDVSIKNKYSYVLEEKEVVFPLLKKNSEETKIKYIDTV